MLIFWILSNLYPGAVRACAGLWEQDLVRDRRILATGYNGAPSKLQHCLDIGCLREKLNVPSGERHELCRGLHAEQNAIIQAALHGVSRQRINSVLHQSSLCYLCQNDYQRRYCAYCYS